jgi:putative DNA primase/helicase
MTKKKSITRVPPGQRTALSHGARTQAAETTPAGDDAGNVRAPRRRAIVTTNMDLAIGTKAALAALAEANDPPRMFLLGDAPVRLEHQAGHCRVITRELTEARLIHELALAVRWLKCTAGGGKRPALPSVAVAKNILASPTLPLPLLERVVDIPVFGRNSILCEKPGYYPASRIYYQPAPSLRIPSITPRPSAACIKSAKDLLCRELLGDFPFVGESGIAHALACMLQPFVRELIDGPTPLHLIEKPAAGTGGTLLAGLLMLPAAGSGLPAMTLGQEEGEARKRITAVLAETPTAVLFDNISKIDSEALSAALTAPRWRDRQLGTSRIIEVPVRCVWLATANNPAVSFEISRRSIRIRLDARIEKPWTRQAFRHSNISGWAIEHRGDLVAAALTLVYGWMNDGRRPGSNRRLGSFESWSGVMGGILESAGVNGFLADHDAFRSDSPDHESQSWVELLERWWQSYGSEPVGVQDIWGLAAVGAESVIDLGFGSERSQRTKLGLLLARMRDRVLADYRISAAGRVQGAQRWRLSRIDDGGQFSAAPRPREAADVGDVPANALSSLQATYAFPFEGSQGSQGSRSSG